MPHLASCIGGPVRIRMGPPCRNGLRPLSSCGVRPIIAIPELLSFDDLAETHLGSCAFVSVLFFQNCWVHDLLLLLRGTEHEYVGADRTRIHLFMYCTHTHVHRPIMCIPTFLCFAFVLYIPIAYSYVYI